MSNRSTIIKCWHVSLKKYFPEEPLKKQKDQEKRRLNDELDEFIISYQFSPSSCGGFHRGPKKLIMKRHVSTTNTFQRSVYQLLGDLDKNGF